jgi:CRP/FNR family transcriptional regulator
MVDLQAIRKATILGGLSVSDLDKLGGLARERRVAHGERLFERGQDADTLYIVLDGCFSLTVVLRVMGEGVETAIEELGTGDALGWSSLVDPRESIYSAWCTEDGRVAAFSRDELEALMDADPALGRRFMRSVAELIGSRVRVLQDLWIEEVDQSMARVMFWTHQEKSTHWVHSVDDALKHRRGRGGAIAHR